MDRISKIIKLCQKVGHEYVQMNLTLQDIFRKLVFKGFDDVSEIEISMCSGGEIILVYYGGEMDEKSIIYAMESKGYITEDDFIGVNKPYGTDLER